MPRARRDAPSMNPLARLIKDRMLEKSWSSYDVERQGGPPARTVQHLADPNVQWKVTPRPETLRKLARGLQIPLRQIQQAATEAVGGAPDDSGTSVHVERVVAAMNELPEHRQVQIATLVAQMIDTWREDLPPLLAAADRGRRTDAVDTDTKAAAERKRQRK